MTVLGDHVGLLRRYVRQYYDGLTDDELHWEPVPGMWGMRLKTELRTPVPEMVPGDYWVDLIRPDPVAPPLTTIAWRVGHLMSVTVSATENLSGIPAPPMQALRYAAAGLLESWWGALGGFVHAVRALSDEQLAAPLPVISDDVTHAGWISHVSLEVAFHSAEVGTMRHLYREMHASR